MCGCMVVWLCGCVVVTYSSDQRFARVDKSVWGRAHEGYGATSMSGGLCSKREEEGLEEEGEGEDEDEG